MIGYMLSATNLLILVGIPVYLIYKIVKWIRFTIHNPREGAIQAISFIIKAVIITILVCTFGFAVLVLLAFYLLVKSVMHMTEY